MLLVYSIYDEKSLTYSTPFFQLTDGIAHRMFSDLVNDPSTTPYKHPGDFKLYWLGYFDEKNGSFTINEQPTYLGSGLDYIDVKPMSNVPLSYSAEITE